MFAVYESRIKDQTNIWEVFTINFVVGLEVENLPVIVDIFG